MQVIPFDQFPEDELVLGHVLDAKAGAVEKHARVKHKMPIAKKGHLLDKCGGKQIRDAFIGMLKDKSKLDESQQQIETLRPRFENEAMVVVLESIGDNVSPHRQVALKLTTVDRDLLLIRHIIARDPFYSYEIPCGASGVGNCVDPRTQEPTILKGREDLRKILTIRRPSPDEVFLHDGRWATFGSNPGKKIDSLKAYFPTCEEEEKSKENGRADESYASEYYLFGQTIADLNGKRMTEQDVRDIEDESTFYAINALMNAEERQVGVDTRIRVGCFRCKKENHVDFFPVLTFLVGWGQTQEPTDQKPSS